MDDSSASAAAQVTLIGENAGAAGAMQDVLLQGFSRYQQRYFGDDAALYEQLKAGQKPTTLVIGCCDSRVHPPALLGTEPGEMFVVRNVANLVPPFDPNSEHASVAAALEFAVQVLQVKRVIVLGHEGCGGIRGLMDDSAPNGSSLAKWLDIAQTAKQAAVTAFRKNPQRDAYEICEQMALLVSLSNLLSYPWLAEKVAEGAVQVDGWYFDMRSGSLSGYDSDRGEFVSLVPPLVCAVKREKKA